MIVFNIAFSILTFLMIIATIVAVAAIISLLVWAIIMIINISRK